MDWLLGTIHVFVRHRRMIRVEMFLLEDLIHLMKLLLLRHCIRTIPN